MNALQNNRENYLQLEEARSEKDTTYFGDILATAIVAFFAVSSLALSGWSAVLYMTGGVQDGGPVGYLFHLAHSLVDFTALV